MGGKDGRGRPLELSGHRPRRQTGKDRLHPRTVEYKDLKVSLNYLSSHFRDIHTILSISISISGDSGDG